MTKEQVCAQTGLTPKPSLCEHCSAKLVCEQLRPKSILDWLQIFRIFGSRGMPSCGATDAQNFNTVEEETSTIYLK